MHVGVYVGGGCTLLCFQFGESFLEASNMIILCLNPNIWVRSSYKWRKSANMYLNNNIQSNGPYNLKKITPRRVA